MLHLICQGTWKTQQWLHNWKRSLFIPIPVKDNAKECVNYCKIALISHASKVMIKILQARLQQCMIWEHGFRKGRGTRDQITSIHWIIEKAREFKGNIYFFNNYAKIFNCVDRQKLWKILKERGIPDHLTCLLRNRYGSQRAKVRTRQGINDWLKTGQGVRQGYILSPCLFNFYAEYNMWNAGLDESQLESRLLGEIPITSNMQMTPPNGRKWRA